MSRRSFLRGFGLRRRRRAAGPSPARPASGGAEAEAEEKAGEERVAVIQGRHCLAYRNLDCSVCHERCPEPGALRLERGIPVVDPTTCTGCGICGDVCPAPTNAIRLLRPPPALRRLAPPPERNPR